MIDYVKKIKDDLVEQFKGKPKIDALLEVIGGQFNDIYRFFEQIRTETDIDNAVGKQLDGIGDIVALTRTEAGKMVAGEETTSNTDDDTYRRHLIFKILKNTCSCTYADMMKAIDMFWKGPPLRYSEDPNKPATICFDFEASKYLADQSIGIPFVKAGGVGLYMTMHKNDEFTSYYGIGLHTAVTAIIECEEVDLSQYRNRTGVKNTVAEDVS